MSILLSTSSFTTEARVSAAPEAVLAVLDDPPGFMRLNPLVVAAEPAPGEADCYLVTDRLRLLGVSFDLRYKVRWQRVASGLDAEVWSSPATRLHNELRVLPDGACARVRETVRMSAPRPLAGYALATAQAAHRDLLDQLERRAESGA
jgi:hypothetical protein